MIPRLWDDILISNLTRNEDFASYISYNATYNLTDMSEDCVVNRPTRPTRAFGDEHACMID